MDNVKPFSTNLIPKSKNIFNFFDKKNSQTTASFWVGCSYEQLG